MTTVRSRRRWVGRCSHVHEDGVRCEASIADNNRSGMCSHHRRLAWDRWNRPPRPYATRGVSEGV